ncbi:unnamed protein product [Rangifer tarandus platyrhynchus]|uniref:Homeobox domain-containing protein n=1 Tax=Rangifer tarandus platyrhynchus TaxID=3082113 RepID=A0ABN8YIH7_RANTA|nr:unnamed protein product [Rangifer tarandus platyrhynchus]
MALGLQNVQMNPLFGDFKGPTGRSAPPKRKRRERTVYSKEQSEALKEALLRTEYPSYRDRLRLAARLHLDEHRVQVRAPRPGLPSSGPRPRCGSRTAGPSAPVWNDDRPRADTGGPAMCPGTPEPPGPPPPPWNLLPQLQAPVSQAARDSTAALLPPAPRGCSQGPSRVSPATNRPRGSPHRASTCTARLLQPRLRPLPRAGLRTPTRRTTAQILFRFCFLTVP